MVKTLRSILLPILLIASSIQGFAQAISVTYPFTSVSTTSGTTDPTPVPVVTGATFGSFSAVGTPANPNATVRFSFTAWPLGATDGQNVFTGSVNTGQYYTVTITPSSGYSLNLTSITFTQQRSATGVRQYVVRGSKDAYATNLPASINPANANLSVVGSNIFQVSDAATGANIGSTVTLDATYTNITTPVTFRFYGFNAEASGGTFSIDDVKFTGTANTSDTTPPVNATNFPAVGNISATTADVSTNLNEAGTTYYVVIPSTGTAPTTTAQVKAGTDGNGVAAFKSGNIAATANTTATSTVTGLTATTAYKAYVVSQDAAGTPNLQTAFSTINFSTIATGGALIDQHINFATTASTTYSSTDYDPGATSDNSGVAITYTSGDPTIATIVANKVHMLKTGIVTITANQSADATHNAATAKQQSLTISAKGLTITGITANSKTYDGNTSATLSGTAALNGVINSDNVTLSGTPTATFSDATIGTNKPVTVTGYTLSGTTAANYTLTQPTGLTASITTPVNTPVIISQYYEGTSTNKWIELTNLSGSPINTASPQLKLVLYNISGDAGNINITGTPSQTVNLNFTIPAYGSVLLANTGNGTEVPYITVASAKQTDNSVINFNGNDGVALTDASNNILDAFGQGINAKDVSYVRNQSVTGPSSTFNINDWTVVPIIDVQNAADLDDPIRLGVHLQPNYPACVAPAAQPTTLAFSNITANSATANFTLASADEYLVIRSLNSTLSANPADGTAYAPGDAIGGGVVVSRLVTGSFTDNALTSGTKYYYYIFALNNTQCTGGPKYLTTAPLTGNVTSMTLPACVTPSAQAASFTVTSFNSITIQGSYTAAAGADQYLIVMSTSPTLTATPADGTTYNVGDQLGGGTIIKRGAGSTFTRSGLNQNTNYYFTIFSLNSLCTGGPLYLRTNPLTGTQKTAVFNPAVLNFYFGNLHGHSSYSDGNKDDVTKTPVDDYAFAKNSMNMDFLGISEHNHTQAGMHLASWQPGIDAAKAATTEKFVAMHGMEWGVISGGGHVVVYGIDSLIGWEAGEYQIYVPKSTYVGTTGLFNIINRHGLNAIATLAHPNTTDFNNLAATYDIHADSAVVGSALESGPAFSTNITYSDQASSMSYLSYYNKMLAAGYHLGATVDHDNHNLTFGRHTRARLVILAPALTENDLLDGMKKMRFYASEDSAARITYNINTQPIGSVFTAQGAPNITVSSATTSPVNSIKLMAGKPGSNVNPTMVASSTSGNLSFSDNTLANLTTDYYYLDITETDGSRIITSPIWYTRDDSFKANQQITIAQTATTTYGDPDVDPAATSNNTTIPITYTSSDPTIATIVNGKVHPVKVGTVNILANQAGNGMYNAATQQMQVLTINPRAVTVTADAKTKVYGDTDPKLTYQVTTGTLINGDVFTGSVSRTAGELVGAYAINRGDLMLNANYALSFTSANLTITAKPITVSANAKSKTYGDADPALTYTTNTALVAGDSFTGGLTRTAGQNAGTYSIGQGTLALNSNYIIAYVPANFTIGQRAVMITADAKTKVFGAVDPALTYKLTAGTLATGDNFTGSLIRNAGEAVGSYAVMQGTVALNTNYSITYTGANFVITPGVRTITFASLPVKTFGDPDFSTGASISSNETLVYTSSNTNVATVVNGNIHIVGAGFTSITAAAPANTNYATTVSLTQPLIVDKASQVIIFPSIPKQFRGDTYSLSGVKSSIGAQVTFTTVNPSIASVSGNTLSANGIGQTNVIADAAGTANYYAAQTVVQQVVVVSKDPESPIIVHKGISPNGDGVNDIFQLEGILDFPQNRVSIYNRTGVLIYETTNYNNGSNAFDGHSNYTGALQQAGTYFYVLEYTDNGKKVRKQGTLVIKY